MSRKKTQRVVYSIPLRVDTEKEVKKAKMLASFLRMGYSKAEIARKLSLHITDIEWYVETYLG